MPTDDPIRNLALAAIDADRQIKTFLQPGVKRENIAISTLFRYANDPGYELPADLAQHLENDPIAQANLMRIISNAALEHIPMLAAAASDTVTRRETDKTVLILTPSRADPAQIYLTIEMKDPEAARPSQIFVSSAEGQWHKLQLAPFVGVRTQTILESEHEVIVALSHPEAVVYFR